MSPFTRSSSAVFNRPGMRFLKLPEFAMLRSRAVWLPLAKRRDPARPWQADHLPVSSKLFRIPSS